MRILLFSLIALGCAADAPTPIMRNVDDAQIESTPDASIGRDAAATQDSMTTPDANRTPDASQMPDATQDVTCTHGGQTYKPHEFRVGPCMEGPSAGENRGSGILYSCGSDGQWVERGLREAEGSCDVSGVSRDYRVCNGERATLCAGTNPQCYPTCRDGVLEA